jgi:hypothetical protein
VEEYECVGSFEYRWRRSDFGECSTNKSYSSIVVSVCIARQNLRHRGVTGDKGGGKAPPKIGPNTGIAYRVRDLS